MRARATFLPPWTTLPDDIRIPVVPAVGDSWYDHGSGYWSGRAKLTLVTAANVALWALVNWAALVMIREGSMLAFHIALGVEVAYSAGIGIYILIQTMRLWNAAAIPVRTSRGWRYISATSDAGRPYQPDHVVGRVLVGLGVLFFGFWLACFITTLLSETLPEHRARLWMADRLRERGLLQTGPAVA